MLAHFGRQAEDRVTGFRGRLVGVAEYATGCNQVQLQPSAADDGSYVDPEWFDDQRIVYVDDTKRGVDTDEDVLGYKASDLFTGFEGYVMGRIEYEEGEVHLLITPRSQNGSKFISGRWIHRRRVRLGADRIVFDNGANPGCDNTPKPR